LIRCAVGPWGCVSTCASVCIYTCTHTHTHTHTHRVCNFKYINTPLLRRRQHCCTCVCVKQMHVFKYFSIDTLLMALYVYFHACYSCWIFKHSDVYPHVPRVTTLSRCIFTHQDSLSLSLSPFLALTLALALPPFHPPSRSRSRLLLLHLLPLSLTCT